MSEQARCRAIAPNVVPPFRCVERTGHGRFHKGPDGRPQWLGDEPTAQEEFERMREWVERNGADYGSVHAAAIDFLFAPGESYDDAWLIRLYEVFEYVEAQPCTCTPESVADDGGCPRCRILNRENDEYVGHGR